MNYLCIQINGACSNYTSQEAVGKTNLFAATKHELNR